MKLRRRTPPFIALAVAAGIVVAGCGNDDPTTAVEASPTVANVGNLPETNAGPAAAAAGPEVVELPGGTLQPDDTDPEPATDPATVAPETAADDTVAEETTADDTDAAAESAGPGDPCEPESTATESTVTESTVTESTVPESTVPESTVTESTVGNECPPSTGPDATETDGSETDGSATEGSATDATSPDDSDGSARPNSFGSPRERWEEFAADADPETFAGGADTADLVEDNRVIMIGDSVMASTSSRYGGEACTQLEPDGWAVEVDAETGRFIDFGMDVLDNRLDAGFDVAVVMLGNNYGANPDVFEDGLREMVDELGEEMPIILYTVSMYREDRVEVNDIVYEIAAEQDNIRVIDWETETTDDPSLTAGDGLHLSDSGRARMIELLADELGEAPDGSDGDCLDSDFTDDSATSGTGTTLPGQAPYTNPPQWTPQPTQPQWTNPPQTQVPQPTEPQPTTPEPTQPQPTEPQPTQPQPTQPQPTTPQPTQAIAPTAAPATP